MKTTTHMKNHPLILIKDMIRNYAFSSPCEWRQCRDTLSLRACVRVCVRERVRACVRFLRAFVCARARVCASVIRTATTDKWLNNIFSTAGSAFSVQTSQQAIVRPCQGLDHFSDTVLCRSASRALFKTNCTKTETTSDLQRGQVARETSKTCSQVGRV